MLDLNQILLEYESTLNIDYADRDVYKIIDNAIKRLENEFKIQINKSLEELQIEDGLISNSVGVLLSQIEKASTDMAYYLHVSMFRRERPVHLGDVNYLGYEAKKLTNALKYLQDFKLYERRGNTISAMTSALNNLEMTTIKRMFIIMLVLERLGVKEGVAVIASTLYLGGD